MHLVEVPDAVVPRSRAQLAQSQWNRSGVVRACARQKAAAVRQWMPAPSVQDEAAVVLASWRETVAAVRLTWGPVGGSMAAACRRADEERLWMDSGRAGRLIAKGRAGPVFVGRVR